MDTDRKPRQGLIDAILLHSKANEFVNAKQEWELTDVSYSAKPHKCPCGQPIKRLCELTNKETDVKLTVGADCTEYFVGIPIDVRFFEFYKELVQDRQIKIPEYVLNYLVQFNYVYPAEVKFLQQCGNIEYVKLTEKQRKWRDKIVHRIVTRTVVDNSLPSLQNLENSIYKLVKEELSNQIIIEEIAKRLAPIIVTYVQNVQNRRNEEKQNDN